MLNYVKSNSFIHFSKDHRFSKYILNYIIYKLKAQKKRIIRKKIPIYIEILYKQSVPYYRNREKETNKEREKESIYS